VAVETSRLRNRVTVPITSEQAMPELPDQIERTRSVLAEEIVQRLEERGVPAGAWLIDVARVRQSLREADDLLRRLEDAIIRSAETSPLDQR
jgi:hypothetical protein